MKEFFIETLYFPGTRAEWNTQFAANDWRNKRCEKIVCADEL